MKRLILIVDDSKMNSMLIEKAFGEEYEFLETDREDAAIHILDNRYGEIAVVITSSSSEKFSAVNIVRHINNSQYGTRFPVFVVMGPDQVTDLADSFFEEGMTDYILKPYKSSTLKLKIKKQIEIYESRQRYVDKLKANMQTIQTQYKMINAQSKQLKEGNQNIIDALGSVVEYRNVENVNHLKNVKKYTEILAKEAMARYPEYGLTPEKINIIVSASALHDIGKILIPDSILLKPGKLTKEEFDYMCSHTIRGYDLIEQLNENWDEEYSGYTKEIARYHHEKYDGKGYVDGLSGENIPISAQLVSIADCLDGLLSVKVYKDAIPFGDAVQMLLAGECGVFSPKLMECLRSSQSTIEQYYREINEENRK